MKPRRTLVLGDVHGGAKALKQVFERANFDPKLDQLIALGDYVDGWSECVEVVDMLIQIQKQRADHIFLLGNHDEWLLNFLETGVVNPMWLRNGGKVTHEAYLGLDNVEKLNEHRKFFKYLEYYYVDDNDKGFVHAGFKSGNALGFDIDNSGYCWDRELWHQAMLKERLILMYPFFVDHEELYIGHTSTLSSIAYEESREVKMGLCDVGDRITVPMKRCNVWNVDTGGGWFGKLTLMDINSKEYWQSDLVQELYPDEKGRK